jgi:signal transduction histidine kinase
MRILSSSIVWWFLRLFFAAVGVAVVNLIWLYPVIQNVRMSASTLALETADRVRGGISFHLETALGEVVQAADEIAFEPERTDIVLNRLLKNIRGFREVAYVDRTGKEVTQASSLVFVGKGGLKNHAAEPHFSRALGGVSNFGDVFITFEGEPHTILAVPVHGLKNIEGVLLATINLRSLTFIVKDVRVDDGLMFVVDQQGYLIIAADITELLKRPNLSERSLVRKVLMSGITADGLDAGDAYRNENGNAMFSVGLPMALTGWGVFFEQPRSQAFRAQQTIIMIAAGIWILGMVIVYIVSSNSIRQRDFNKRLRDFLQENYEVGKILVRRDLDLTEANARLEMLDTSKSEFVSVAAHQLRTPLTGIRWTFNALLDEDNLESLNISQQKMVEDGLKATIRVVNLINDLLNVARIEEGRFGFHFKKQSFLVIVDSVAKRAKQMADSKGILFFLDASPTLPLLNLDTEKIGIVLDNMLDNALKYTAPGGEIIMKVWQDNRQVVVSVKDTGIGIPQGQIHRLFDKFFRAENAQRVQTSGSGLGLYVTKNIVESHGGSIWIESEENKGTTLTFALPIPDASSEGDGQLSQNPPEDRPQNKDAGPPDS